MVYIWCGIVFLPAIGSALRECDGRAIFGPRGGEPRAPESALGLRRQSAQTSRVPGTAKPGAEACPSDEASGSSFQRLPR